MIPQTISARWRLDERNRRSFSKIKPTPIILALKKLAPTPFGETLMCGRFS